MTDLSPQDLARLGLDPGQQVPSECQTPGFVEGALSCAGGCRPGLVDGLFTGVSSVGAASGWSSCNGGGGPARAR